MPEKNEDASKKAQDSCPVDDVKVNTNESVPTGRFPVGSARQFVVPIAEHECCTPGAINGADKREKPEIFRGIVCSGNRGTSLQGAWWTK